MFPPRIGRQCLWMALTSLLLAGTIAGCAVLYLIPPGDARAAELGVVQQGRFRAGYFGARLAMAAGDFDQALARLEELRQTPGCPPPVIVATAEIYLKKMDLDAALRVLNEGIDSHPQSVQLRFLRGKLLASRKQLPAAIEDFNAGLKIEPDRQDLLDELSSIHLLRLREADSPEALKSGAAKLITTYERMLKGRQGQDRIVPLLVLSWLYQRFEQPDKALERADEAVQIDPHEIRCLMALGAAQEQMDQADVAFESYRRALLIDPLNLETRERVDEFFKKFQPATSKIELYRDLAQALPQIKEVQIQWARMLIDGQQWGEADVQLGQILEEWPENQPSQVRRLRVWLALDRRDAVDQRLDRLIEEGDVLASLAVLTVAEVLINQGDPAAAIVVLEKFEAGEAISDNVTLALGTLLIENNQHERAVGVLETYIKRRPDHFYGALLMATSLTSTKRYDEAHQRLDAISEADQQRFETEILHLRAQIWRNQKEYEKALEVLNRLIEAHSEEGQFQLEVGFLYQEMGRMDEAERAYRRALELNPQDPETHNTLGYFYAETNQRLDEALRLIMKAMELRPNAGHIVDSLGWVFFLQGDFEQAIENLENAVELMEKTPDSIIYEHLGDAYERVGNLNNAREAWRKALDINHDAKHLEEKLNRTQPQ